MRAAGIAVDDQDPLLITMAALLNERAERYGVFDSMPDVLSRLAARHVLYVVTSNVGSVVRADLKRFAIDAFTDVLGSEAGRSKVDKMRALMDRHPGHAPFYVGDTSGDMREGRGAGVNTVAVTWGWHTREMLLRAEPRFVVDSPSELVALFQANA
jgi:phosphoglycolate phosphatase